MLWWYILPLSAAALLVRYGVGGDQVPLLGFVPLVVVLGACTYCLNRWYSRKHFESEVDRVQALLADFDRAV